MMLLSTSAFNWASQLNVSEEHVRLPAGVRVEQGSEERGLVPLYQPPPPGFRA
jgi:hypothetical protein